MSAIPTARDNPNGLHQRYRITKTSGEPVDHLATYFVLRIDSHGHDALHIAASRAAARAYAEYVLSMGETHLEQMAIDLAAVVDNLEASDG